MKIEYNGEYPNLCSGRLKVTTLDGKEWVFPDHCMLSGGSVTFDESCMEHVGSGPWSIIEWPESFPEVGKAEVVKAVNDSVTLGCCGGCV